MRSTPPDIYGSFGNEPVLAGEIGVFDRVHGAVRLAGAAVDALIVIYDGKVINDGDRLSGAVLCAFAAGDTAVGAFAADYRALIVIGAGDDNAPHVREKGDQVVRASLGAQSAADAFSCIDMSYAVLDTDRVVRADLLAVAEAHAAVGAMPPSAVKHVGGGAGLYAPVILFIMVVDTVAVAVYESDLLNDVFELNAHYL